jgi:hypothetical protein
MIAKTYTCSLLGIDAILVIEPVNNTTNCCVKHLADTP